MNYSEFLEKKTQCGADHGFEPVWYPEQLFDFQRSLVDWSCRKGRAAVFSDCGTGKTIIQLTWAENVARKTNGRVLILTPLAVGAQTVREGEKFGVECYQSRDGKLPDGKKIIVTNYEKLHLFNSSDFVACVCDESSILKNYSGATRNEVIAFMRTIEYRLLCTATPSPNDYTEIGNSVEALGIMRRVEMLAQFFIHDASDTGQWRLKGHGAVRFWRFMASWARAVRFPSDLGFDDADFILPAINVIQHTLKSTAAPGWLFPVEARTLNEQRGERRDTIEERCGVVATLANENKSNPFVAWCSLNSESDMLAKNIIGSCEVTGSQSNDEKEDILTAFASGELRALVTKPDICGFGLNWQHCNTMSFFPSHSHEQYYQAVRRCWRFGQLRPVSVHVVTTEAESRVVENMKRKENAASEMFDQIVKHMRDFYQAPKKTYTPHIKMETPKWI